MDDGFPVPFAGCTGADPGQLVPGRPVLVGLPDDSRSSFLRGCAAAPQRIRLAYDGRCFNSCTEQGTDLAGRVADLGDWQPHADPEETLRYYRDSARALFARGVVPFVLGGDHGVTIPIAQALDALGTPVHVVQFDAHPDLYPEYDGDRFSHACTAARILEMPHIVSLTQIGVRTFTPIQQEAASRHGQRYHCFPASELTGPLPPLPHLEGAAVYLTMDVDGLDPAFAPGVSHPVPGGLSSRQVLGWIGRVAWRIVGMDVVEVNPARDLHDQTAILAARLVHEAMGRLPGID